MKHVTIGCILIDMTYSLFFNMDNIDTVIDKIAHEKLVEKIVYKVNRHEDKDDLQDLIQDIYMQLLTKRPDRTIELYNKKQLNFFIARIVTNNICSSTSPYYTKYKKRKKHEKIDENRQ